LLTGLVLATCFGFIYVHSGRNANTDATFALVFALVVVTLWASDRRPWQAVWLGPLLGASFLLRGPAAVMFVVLIGGYWAARQDWLRGRKRVALLALLLFLVPVIAWLTARWRIDQERFIVRMFGYDMIARTTRPIEGHAGSPFYYLNILAKHQYDWLLAAIVAALVVPGWHRRALPFIRSWRRSAFSIALVVWAVVGLVVPTIISTKVPWYLNHSYPVFAVGVALLVVNGFAAASASLRRTAVLAAVVMIALLTAESKLLWYSYHQRDLSRSPQGLLLTERQRLSGHRVFRSHWDRSEIFLIGGVIGAERGLAAGVDDFLVQSRPGDFLFSGRALQDERLRLAQSDGRHWLYRRER
jgi:MFS family permease